MTIENPELNVSFFALFRYADVIDYILIVVGTFCALGSAGIFPLMFYAYGDASSAFVDYEASKNNKISNTTCKLYNQILDQSLY